MSEKKHRRQQLILEFLPRHPKQITVADLMEKLALYGYRTSKRTIQRDLIELETSNELSVNCDKRESTFGWSQK